jgi:hypothetical protein
MKLLAEFVERWGVRTDEERRFVAAALIHRPDARKSAKPQTEALLADLDHALRYRRFCNEQFVPNQERRLVRARQWLGRQGLPEEAITEKLKSRSWSVPAPITMDQVYAWVGNRHCLTPEAVKQAHHRRMRKKRDDAA